MPVARIGDMVFFPECGLYPIITGGPMWLNEGRPLAHLLDAIPCPGGALIISGAFTFLDTYRPVARVGDLAYGGKCQLGMIVTGSLTHIQGI